MTATCPSCGSQIPDGFRFCGHCGTRLDDVAAAAPRSKPTVHPTPSPVGAERRHVTVMFCDLVDSTALAERLDPEELREIIRAFQSAAADAVTRYGGHIAQYLGDGLLVYFGYPQAHEDDARRGVHAGLGVVDAVRQLRARTPGPGANLAVRVGVHTGPVVAGEIGAADRREFLALGATPNIAARLQGLAQPDTVVLSGSTLRLLGGRFECEPMGAHLPKGLTTPIEVFRVVGAARDAETAEVPIEALTPSVGRHDELQRLRFALQGARAGTGSVLQVSGGPGFGKSRLVRMFREDVGDAVRTWLVARCSPYEETTAFGAVIGLLQRVIGTGRDDERGVALDRLVEVMSSLGVQLDEAVPLFADLLSIPLEGRYPPVELMFNKRRDRTIELLVATLLTRARQEPTVLAIEDVHWADPSTRQFLHALVAQVPAAPLLTILTFRPGFNPSWEQGPTVIEVTLDRLADDDARRLLDGLLQGYRCPPEVVQRIVAKTDGVPLYIEELTKMLLESGQLRRQNGSYVLAGPLASLEIPDTLQASLMARLDWLGEAKQLAQLGAVLGREFGHDVLAAVWPGDATGLADQLRRLLDSGLVFQRGAHPVPIYVFKHALIQDAAYESLLRAVRQQYHHRVAETLTDRFPDLAERSPELLARHYEGAALPAEAIRYWVAASRRAFWRSAYLEAIEHCRRGLAAVDLLPTGERIQPELELLVALGPALTATRGYADPEVGRVYSRAQELCAVAGDTPQLFWVLWGIGSFYFNRAQLRKSFEQAQTMLRLANAEQDQSLLREAYFALGVVGTMLGEIAESCSALERGVALITPDRDRRYTALTGVDCGVATLSFAALAAQLSDQGDRALTHIRAAIAEGRRLQHPFSLGFALTHAVFLHAFRREPDLLAIPAQEGLALCEERGLVTFTPLISFCLGAAEGGAAGLQRMEQSLAIWRAMGEEVWQPFFLAGLGEWHAAEGRTDEARALIEEGIALAERTDERIWYPALLCLRGDLAATREEAEVAYQAAGAAARLQGALMFERRAVAALERRTTGGQADGRTGGQ